MASTNKTTNYELSQFLGSDKPAWLSDYNSDMNKIDTQMKANADAATAAGGTASSAATAIGDLTDLTTTAKTSAVAAINEVDANADTAQNTASSAITASNTNAAKIEALEGYLNINNFTTASVSVVGGTSSSSVSCATNTDGSLGKIYGSISVSSTTNSTTVTFATPLRPNSAMTINGIATRVWSDAPSNPSSYSYPIPTSISIGTDGTATLNVGATINGRTNIINISACLIFAKSFGDIPVSD